MQKKLVLLAVGCCLSGMAVPAHVTLIDLGNSLIYDDARDVTWYDGHQDSGWGMDFSSHFDWAEELEYGGLTDWRLPILDEFLSLGSEMRRNGVFDPSPFKSILHTQCLTNTWETVRCDSEGNMCDMVYFYRFNDNVFGEWYRPAEDLDMNTMAVIDGKRSQGGENAPPVPEPATMVLTGLGLAGFGLSKGKRKKAARGQDS